eukprot:TRINITY_DN27204_c0_g1_i1.p1 TRINITY_DN27204_c0_g1~~TRINITY_DN27204_c0_g1_i1.p1  ORF type:complete len:817 (-),score=158.84 TRINITY_DN27204_c0_g1_i1:35-2485(-)
MVKKLKIRSLSSLEVEDLNGRNHLGDDVWWQPIVAAGVDNDDVVADVARRLEEEPKLIEERTRLGLGVLQWSALTAGSAPGIPASAKAIRNHLIRILSHEHLNAGCQGRDGKESPYEGLTLLHIIVAQRDQAALKALLARGPGLDLKVQATGSFFKELVSEAEMYYGEYPLSFAVSIGWIEGLELLAQYAEGVGGWRKGGLERLVYLPDTFGNTALHMAVRHNRKDSYDWLRGHVTIDLRRMNRMGLTVVSMAVLHNDGDMFDHVFGTLCRVKWQMGHVTTFTLLLDQVDSVPMESSFSKYRTVLELALLNGIGKVVTNPFMQALLDAKWKMFARPFFALSCIMQLVYLYLLSTTIDEYSRQEEFVTTINATNFGQAAPINSSLHSAEVGVFVMTMFFLMGTSIDLTSDILHKKNQRRILEAAEQSFQEYVDNHLGISEEDKDDTHKAKLLARASEVIGPSRGFSFMPVSVYDVIGWIGQFCLTAHFIAFQVIGKGTEATAFLSLGALFVWQSTMSLLLPWKTFGILVIIVVNVMKEDITTFLVLLVIALAGFSQAVRVLEVDPDGFHNGFYGMMTFFRMTMGEKPAWTKYSANKIGNLQDLALVLFVLFVLLTAIALLRLLISMFNGTYQQTMKVASGVWRLQWGATMLRLERRLQLCTPRKFQQRFMVLDNPGEPGHAYVFQQLGGSDGKDESNVSSISKHETAIVDALQERLTMRGRTIEDLKEALKSKEQEVASLKGMLTKLKSTGEAMISAGAVAAGQVEGAVLHVPGTVIEEAGSFLGKGVQFGASFGASALDAMTSVVNLGDGAADRVQ